MHGQICLFLAHLTLLTVVHGIGANSLQFQKVGVKSQRSEKRGVNSQSVQNSGKNAIAPIVFAFKWSIFCIVQTACADLLCTHHSCPGIRSWLKLDSQFQQFEFWSSNRASKTSERVGCAR